MPRPASLLPALSLLLLALAAAPAQAQSYRWPDDPPTQPLWPAGAPGAVGTEYTDQPGFLLFRAPPALANGAAVVVLPGGGYANLAVDHEGVQVARWLNSIGVTALVTRYRLGPKYRHPTMLHDAQRAIRTARARAAEWGVDPNRIGILGFSAGGHLASTTGTHFDAGTRGDAIDAVSSRPDFMMLLYPVVTMDSTFTHRGSLARLLGSTPDPALVTLLSSEKQVTPRTPPTFLVHTVEDPAVPVENSVEFFRALRAHGVPAEMHLYQWGRHGLGLGLDDAAFATWTDLAAHWLRRLGVLTPGGSVMAAPAR